MTRDDIIRMAREAFGAEHELFWMNGTDEYLERFAALVAAHTLSNIDPSSFMSWQEGYAAGAAAEQEKVARWQIGSGYTTGHGDTIEDLLTELEWQVRESEREACAGLCGWRTGVRPVDAAIETCAAAIRARSEK